MSASKKTIRLVLLLTGILLSPVMDAAGQISFTLSDIESLVGQLREVQTFETETTAELQALVNTSGADQTWDFSAIVFEETTAGTIEIVPLPADVPGADDPAFEDATHVMVIAFESQSSEADSSAWNYQSFDSDGAYSYGFFFLSSEDVDGDGSTPDEVVFSYNPRFQTAALPLTFGTEWTSETTQTFTVAEQSFSTDVSLQAEVDGYGTLMTPSGSAPCLRVRNELSVTTFGFTSTTTSFDFITKEGITASISLDQTGQPTSASYQTQEQTGTDIERMETGLPDAFRLDQNYPNPFNPQTAIRYALPEEQHVKLTIFDVLGRAVELLVDQRQAAGTYEVTFQTIDLPSGVYAYRLETPSFTQTRTMLLSK